MFLIRSSDLIKGIWKYVSTNTSGEANLTARAPFRRICAAIPTSPTGALSQAFAIAYSTVLPSMGVTEDLTLGFTLWFYHNNKR